MQNVSQKWKDNQTELLTSESFVELSLKLTDPDAYEDATAEHNGSVYFSDDANYVVSEVDKHIDPHTTLERNLWVLDGSRKILPASNYGENGFIGDVICGANSTFSKNPIISINFSKVFTDLITGVSIVWSGVFNEYATDFIVTAYNDNTIVASTTITNNKEPKMTAYVDIAGYNRITIEVLKWSLPYRRARITSVQIGTDLIYGKSEIINYSHSQSVDPISATLPISKISFAINNVDDTFNPNNLNSLAKYLIERQEVKVRYGYKLDDEVEWIDGGTFYLSEWDAPQNGLSAEFTARDLLEFMSGMYYYGIYNPNGTSLYDLAERILIDADLPLDESGTVKWVIDPKLKNIYTVAPLPIDTHANCLQMIANAGECVIYQDRNGILHIETMSYEETDYSINLFNSYSKSDIALSKPLKEVTVPCYSYSIETEPTELYKGTVNIGGTLEVLVTYSGTATNVSATVTGGTLKSAQYYSNACLLNITATGSVDIVVSGNSLSSSSVSVVITSDTKGETISVDNPLITSHDRAVSVGEWVENYMKNRMVLSSDWRADPRLDALDVVSNENSYNINKVLMTSVDYSYNGAFKGKGEGRVIEWLNG